MTTVCKNRNCSVGAILLCLAAVSHVDAKSISYTPDITSDTYWDSHYIAVVRVTSTEAGTGSGDQITYQAETVISGGSAEPARTIPVSHLRFESDAELPPIAVNDRLVLYYGKEARSQVAAVRLDGGPAAQRLLSALGQIAKLRENGADQQAYMASIFGRDSTVARYCLRHLLEQRPGPPANSDNVAALLRLRDGSPEIPVRMLATRLAARLEGRGDYSDEEYSWLRGVLAGSKDQRWTELNPLVERLLGFENRRSDSVTFLSRLALDPNADLQVRIAAYGAFEDPRMFHFEGPDADSELIFQSCTQMLRDPEAPIRGAGAALLHNLSVRLNPAIAARYIERSRTAIADALALESNADTRHQFENYLEQIGTRH